MQADEADEGRHPGDLDGPEAEAASLEFLLDATHEVCRFGPGTHPVMEVLHDGGIGVHRREWVEVVLSPAT